MGAEMISPKNLLSGEKIFYALMRKNLKELMILHWKFDDKFIGAPFIFLWK